MKIITVKLLLLALLFLSHTVTVRADESEPRQELEVIDQYALRNNADQEPIEKIDPVSGELILKYTDFTIKGQGGLDINLVRQYRSMSASEHPYTGLFGMGWRMDFGRLRPISDLRYTVGPIFEDQDGNPHQFFTKLVAGKSLHISKDNWKLEKNVDYSEELKDLGSHKYTSQGGFKITSPDGIAYHAGVSRVEATDAFGSNPARYYYVHRIEDKYGNNIVIDWTDDPGGFFPALTSEFGPTRIEKVGFQPFGGGFSTQLTFNYELLDGHLANTRQPVLSRIVGKTKSVDFKYEDKGFFDGNVGNIFVPLRAKFKYRHPTIVTAKSYYEEFNYTYYSGDRTCSGCGAYLLKQRKEPSGLQADYKWIYFDLTLNIYKNQAAISKKTVSGNIQQGGIWQYDYATKTKNRFGEISLNSITTPTKQLHYYYYNHDQSKGNIWRTGLMQKEVIKNLSGQVFQTKEYVYNKQIFISGQYKPYPPRRFDYDYYDQNNYLPLTTQIEIIRGQDVYTQNSSDFNSYGAPQTQVEIGPTGETRRTDFSYYTNKDLWIINQPQDDVIAGVGSITRDYNNLGDVERIDEFNQPQFIYYDNDGNLKQTTDANGNKTYYKDYKMGLPQRIEYPESKVVTSGVVFPGVLSWERDGEGHRKDFSYNYDRLTSIKPPLGDKFNIDYIGCKPNSNSNCTGIQITRGTNQKKVSYDGYWKKTSVTENGQSHHFRYDAEGRKTFESYLGTPSAGVSFQYDVLDRPIKITKPGGVFTTIQYLPGNQVKITDENNIPVTEYYQSFGNPDERFLERIDTAKNTTWIETDPLGLIKSVQQGNPGATPNGLKRIYSYNARRQLIGFNNPETGLTTFGRDLAGNMISQKVGNSPVTRYYYDGLHRLKYIQYPVKTNSVTITYNKNDQIKKVDNTTTQRSFSYDSNNNLKTEDLSIDQFTFELDYNYNSRDQLESIQYPSGELVKYHPDARGRPTKVGNYVNSVSYHPNDIVKQVNYANNTQLFSTYNNRHLVETIKIKNPTTSLIDLTYGYDAADNVKIITDALGNTFDVNLSYDKVYQLETAKGVWGNGSVNYNPYGDITQKQMGPKVLNYTYKSGKLDTLNNIKFLYDAYGNVVSNHRADFYDFGDASELLSANDVKYGYDGGNTLVKKQAANGKITYSFYAYKNSKLLAEYDGEGTIIREYAYLQDQLVAALENVRPTWVMINDIPIKIDVDVNEVTYYHWNALSSTVLATDSSGNKAWEENYLPYGKQIKGEEDERSSVFYTGKHTDRDTGLTYLSARWYDAEIGRFISVDPLTFQLDNPKSFGRYVYANNNPYKYVDPTGESAVATTFAVIVYGGGAAFTAYDVFSSYQEGGISAATQTLAVDAALTIAGGKLATKLGSKVYEAFKTSRVSNIVGDAPKRIDDGVMPGSVGASRVWTKKGRLKAIGLPTTGKIRFVPRKGYDPSNPLPRGPNKGVLDRFGNEWTKGPSRTQGQAFEWDVQLSKTGKQKLGWATRNGSHANVSLDGRITHR